MAILPSLYLSHGSPTIILENSEAREFLRHLGRQMAKPRAILVASAHFETQYPTLTATKKPETIYDFGARYKELYEITYQAPGNPQLAGEIAGLLKAGGLKPRLDPDRGLDHGAWVPLSLMYPKANIPVLQISLQTAGGPKHHFKLGELLRPLRKKGVLVIGSGSATHNLQELFTRGYALDDEAPQWVVAFSEWVAQAVKSGDMAALLDYRQQAPHAVENHPTEEHFLPLFLAAGAGDAPQGQLIHASHTYGILAMDAYRFD